MEQRSVSTFHKAELVGIRVMVTEESSTSTASFLDADHSPAYGVAAVPAFSGRRVKPGLYRTADGRHINADVHGAYHIIRTGAPEAFVRGSSGCVVHPVRLAA
jgi:putative transposase